MNLYEELKARGFIYQETDSEAVKRKLNDEKTVFYVGFDPTGDSLHVGHLLPVMAMRLLQKAGHTPIALVGGATGQIGDPSGKSAARNILSRETVAHNAQCLKQQLSRFISVEDGKAVFANNNDWFGNMLFIDFLRDIGSKFSVNRMLTQESVKSRLENGLSFLEFSYSLFQAYDFYRLNQTYGCSLEMGGQDQWGNMVAGTELVRRMTDGKADVQCLTIPLLLNSNGQKFGKTAGGANVWLDTNRSSVFEYYQFWRNCDDAQTRKLLCYFSSVPVAEIDAILSSGNINRAKEILAFEATALAHGEAAAKEAYLAAGGKFGFADPEGKVATTSAIAAIDVKAAPAVALPKVDLSASLFEGAGLGAAKLLVEAGICKSTSDGRRLIQGGAVFIDETKLTNPAAMLTRGSLPQEFTLRAGKKNFRRIVIA